jgi:hypothetical protein
MLGVFTDAPRSVANCHTFREAGMRRVATVVIVLVAAIALAAPGVSAQPKVTITGLIDNISSWTSNLSMEDLNPSRGTDDEWYARTRVRPDIVAEVGTTKFVLGLEIDYVWGQVGAGDGSFGAGGPQRFGSTAGFDQNTDVAGIMEVKWAYTEFVVPLLPFRTLMRVGAQPYQVMYKPGVLATGDFPGIHLMTELTPMVRTYFTWTQIEEESTGPRDGFIRGEDFALFTSVEITPFKGLDIRPLFSWANYDGVTNGSSRRGRGGVGTGAGIFPLGATEDRFTAGVDARWRSGPFFVQPTVLYQWGQREQVRGGVLDELHKDAWYVDLRGGWQAGPLLLEAAVIYTTGNKAEDRIDVHPDQVNSTAARLGRGTSRMRFFETISTDRGNFSTWCEIQCSNIDYHNRFRAQAANLDTGHTLGYDKYGIIRLGLRANYALTPAFTVRGMASAAWTAEEVDTSSTIVAGTALTPGDARGDSRYYGTELNLGFQWRFAPNVALDMVGSYFFTGSALSAHTITSIQGVTANGRDPKDVQVVSARVRYTF